ncbi:aminoglycoside phosphotransferase family protein [Pseudomonas resinovorans]|uniref:aminoglycoside phosphotransferase family protein n=1 Tax=Metapseudomonas resinovorans TaxID=53412 RepID=UPI00237EF937|nr:aminoglycoside phosphotransferase family protein [Pseudomonas resinovorans]MDE3738646.1 aminoglycoside phosphotransferase family protein [Pseudomonas resinovorans]
MFEPYLTKWTLQPDGAPIHTPGSDLLPVRFDGLPAMLKIARDSEEKVGALVMRWWGGEGAARVYRHEGDALLLERATGPASLIRMALEGEDDQASRIACATIARLHAPRPAPAPELVTLEAWFRSLWPVARRQGGLFAEAAGVARELLGSQREVVVLHGDVHHENVLDFGERGWLAIDPKRVIGDRGYDYANLICNPELPTVTQPARFARQVEVIAEASGLGRERLLRWVLAYAGLSAAWFLEDGDAESAESDMRVARLAAEALDR